ncbi:hypothetical protein RFI_30537, partial [Reticulomyxa filosa]
MSDEKAADTKIKGVPYHEHLLSLSYSHLTQVKCDSDCQRTLVVECEKVDCKSLWFVVWKQLRDAKLDYSHYVKEFSVDAFEDAKQVSKEEFIAKLVDKTKLYDMFSVHTKLARCHLKNAGLSDVAEESQSSLRFDLSPEMIIALEAEIEKETTLVYDQIAQLTEAALTPENVLLPLIQFEQ